MTKNTILKIVIGILLAIILVIMFTGNSFALNYDISTKFSNTGDKSEATNKISSIIGSIINVVQVVGVGVAIIMLIVLGIRWISSASMPTVKAQVAKSARYYIMGAIFIFAAVGILQIIKNFTKTNVVANSNTTN